MRTLDTVNNGKDRCRDKGLIQFAQYSRIISGVLQHQKDPYNFNFIPEVSITWHLVGVTLDHTHKGCTLMLSLYGIDH